MTTSELSTTIYISGRPMPYIGKRRRIRCKRPPALCDDTFANAIDAVMTANIKCAALLPVNYCPPAGHAPAGNR